MPKLAKEAAAATAQAESGSFDPLPAGVYVLQLRDVDGERVGPKGPYWSWEFDVVDCLSGDEKARGRQWVNTSLADNAQWKMNETFSAFGVDTDADTDELIGQYVKGRISVGTIPYGAKAGELGNNVEKLEPLDEGYTPPKSKREDDLDF